MAEAEHRRPVVRDKDDLQERLRKIEGQVRGIQRMIEEDRYCVDVLVQLAAVRAAMNKVGLALMEGHARGCMQAAARRGGRRGYNGADGRSREVYEVVRGRQIQVGRDAFSLVLASIFSVPLLINLVATRMGFFLFPVGDPALQWGYATLVLLAAWPIHLSAVSQVRSVRPGLALIVSLAALALYVASAYYVWTGSALPPFPREIWFDTVALLLLAALSVQTIRHGRTHRL